MCVELDMKKAALNSIEAEFNKTAIKPITDTYPNFNVDDGYKVQKIRENIMLERGYKLIGGKMGLTSIAKMKQMGSKEPLYGKLFDYMLLKPDENLKSDELIHPRVEAEIAFLMKKDLYGPFVTSADVLDATEVIIPAYEIIDSRYFGFKFKNPDSVADNISASRFKLGAEGISPKKIDIEKMGVVTRFSNGEELFATGGAVLGHPARAVAMYVNMISKFGDGLLKGQVVLSGAITAATPVSKGLSVKSYFQGIGEISMNIE
jgi:2-oxo-3-hexenedioate decarboxylase